MEKRVFLIMMLSGMTTLSSAFNQYHFINVTNNWTEAQKYCRSNYVDLATIENTDDMARLRAAVDPGFTGKAWIGLYDDLNSWKWSLVDPDFYGPGETEFRNWYGGEPNNAGGREDCVVMLGFDLRWNDLDCVNGRSFVCYDGRQNATERYVLISQPMTWTAAQSYCRRNNTDLVSIRNQTENQAVRNVASTTEIWIGLYRTKLWSDGSNSNFTDWSPGEPNNNKGANCVSAWVGDSGRWTDESCDISLPFFCYSVLLTTSQLPLASAVTSQLPLASATTTQLQTAIQTMTSTTNKGPVNIIRLTAKLSSAIPLTADNITNEVSQQLREELIKRGVRGDFKLLISHQGNSMQP